MHGASGGLAAFDVQMLPAEMQRVGGSEITWARRVEWCRNKGVSSGHPSRLTWKGMAGWQSLLGELFPFPSMSMSEAMSVPFRQCASSIISNP